MSEVFQISSLTLLITALAVIFFIILLFILQKQKYENQINILNEKIETTISQYEEKLDLLNASFDDNLINQKNTYDLKLSNQQELFQKEEKSFQEKLLLLEDSKQQLKMEFENLANKLFDENQKKSNTNLNQVLTGFKGELNNFGKRVNDIYNEETKQRSSLLTEIKNLKELNNQISKDALNLTKALKGENKTQGDWGEMILSTILEQTGLREGTEYKTQGSYTDEHGKRLRPDVIVHLPSNKDIIIDSKVSLNAYLDYSNGEDDTKRELALKSLLTSIKTHIKDLSNKRYENIEGIRTLDFVLMFIPVEQAFLLATSRDEALFKTAFESNIMLVSPSTLYATLRTIENIWANERQNENAKLISKKAADLYDKFAGFVKDIEDIGININRTQKAYENATNKLYNGKGNLIRRSQEFVDLGVQPKKQIETKNLLED